MLDLSVPRLAEPGAIGAQLCSQRERSAAKHTCLIAVPAVFQVLFGSALNILAALHAGTRFVSK